MKMTRLVMLLGLVCGTFGGSLRGIRHNYRSIQTDLPAPTPAPSSGLEEYVLPIYDPPVETQELIPPSPLPSPIVSLYTETELKELNPDYIKQPYLCLPTPYPKIPQSLVYLPTPTPTPRPIFKILQDNDYYPIGSYSLGSPLLMLPPVTRVSFKKTHKS